MTPNWPLPLSGCDAGGLTGDGTGAGLGTGTGDGTGAGVGFGAHLSDPTLIDFIRLNQPQSFIWSEYRRWLIIGNVDWSETHLGTKWDTTGLSLSWYF